MTRVAAVDDTIVQETSIRASAARIFAALTHPDKLLHWWSAEGLFRIMEAECDLRVGGKWRMRVAGSCGPGQSDSIVYGEYRTIEPPSLLIFTWNREHEDHPETLVRWDLDEKNGVTRVRVTHSGLVTEALKARNSGWPMIVELLAAYMAQPAQAAVQAVSPAAGEWRD